MVQFLLRFTLFCTWACVQGKAPNIIVIVADDLGYNDVSWHNRDMFTPNLEKLAMTGVRLEQSYVQPICTPTRSALMTGRYPIHTGRQHGVLWPEEPRGLFANLTLLPQHLQQRGYDTHMVGKWHLGFCNETYLPTRRGFNSYYGYWTGSEDYYQHTRGSQTEPHTIGYDFRDNEDVAYKDKGKYSAHLFAARAEKIIEESARKATSEPLFLYLAFQSVHAPLQVPEEYEKPYEHIQNKARRTYCGMVTALDEAVGNITQALKKNNMDKNTLIVFTADNGGQVMEGGNNYPLRGNKNTLWEGGTRAAAFIHGSMLLAPGTVSHALIHVTDWLPTLVSAAGSGRGGVGDVDGVDQWEVLMTGSQDSNRKTMLYNIDPRTDPRSGNGPNAAIREGQYKLIVGHPGRPSGWIPPPQYENVTITDLISDSYRDDEILLFDLYKDPYEMDDLSRTYPQIVKKLQTKLQTYMKTMLEPDIINLSADGNPSLHNNTWSTGWCKTVN